MKPYGISPTRLGPIGQVYLILISLVSFSEATHGVDVYWTNTAGGNWSTAANWSTGIVPGPSDNAFIITNGAYAITLDVNATVKNFTMGGTSGAQTLSNSVNTLTVTAVGTINSNAVLTFNGGALNGTNTVSGVLNWTGGSIFGVLTVASNGTMNLSGSATKTIQSGYPVGIVTNWGTVVWGGSGQLSFLLSGAAFYNQPGALFDIQGDATLQGSGLQFHNAGLFRKSAGSGTSTIGMSFYNSGAVSNLSGTLSFTGGGTLDGTFAASAGTTILFANGNFTLDAMPSFSGPGTVEFAGGNTFIYFTVPISNFTLSGGALNGTNTVSGVLNWTGGSIFGVLTVASNGIMNLSGSATKTIQSGYPVGIVTNWGTVVWGGSGQLSFLLSGAAFYNQPGALFDIQGDATLQGSGLQFHNAGLFRKSAGGGTSTIGMSFYNSGAVTNLSGTLSFTGGGTLDGTFAASASTTISFANGNFTLDAMPSFSGPGTVEFVGGNTFIYFTVPISNFTLSGGALNGTNTVSGVLNWTGGSIFGVLTVASNGTMNLSGSATKTIQSGYPVGIVTNWGTVVWGGSGQLSFLLSGAAFYNQPGALFDIQGDATLQGSGLQFHNAGLFRKSAGSGTSTIGMSFYNSGAVSNLSGTLSFTGGGTLDGTFAASAGTTILFANGNFTLDAMPSFSGPGTVEFAGGNTFIYFTVPISNFTLSGGALNGTNTVSGVLNWTGGSIFGVLTVASNGIMNLSGSATKTIQSGYPVGIVTNWGTVVWGGSGQLSFLLSGAAFYNQPGALFDIQGDATLQGSGLQFHNAGLFRKSAGGGTSTIGMSFYNSGAVTNLSGTLSFTGGGTLDGTFAASASTTISFANGNFTLDAMPSFSGPGTVEFVGGNTFIYFTVPISNFTLSGGALNGTNTVSGVLNWTGGSIFGVLTVASNGIMNLSGSATKTIQSGYPVGIVTNWGTVVWGGSGQLSFLLSGAAFYNQPGALFDIQGDATLQASGSGLQFYNAGLFRKSAGSGTSTIGISFNNSGTLSPLSGVLAFSAGGLNLLGSGTLQFSIGLAQSGQVVTSGALLLGGALNISLTNGFVPTVGNMFRILTWGPRRGGFSQANGFDLGNGLYFQAIADQSGLSLVTKTTVVPTRPPPTNLLDQVVAFGDTAVFSFSPLGVEPFTYQWTFYSTNLPGQINSSLIITNVQSANLWTYCVKVVDALSVSNIYCADLSAITAAGIASHPNGLTTNSGTNITLTATGSGGAPLRYQWRLNGANIPYATNSTYTITNAQPRDGGTYSVLVANPVRVISSSNAKVKVLTNNLPFGDNFAARGNANSFSGVGSGSNTNATREGGEPNHGDKTGSHSVWLQWTAPASGVATFNTRGSSFDTLLAVYSGTSVSNLTAVVSDDDRGGYFTSEVAFNATNGASYQIAVDGFSTASGEIVLGWNLDTNITQIPKIIQQPLDITVSAGGTATFSVFAASTTNLFYQWFLGGWLAFPGGTNATLVVSNVSYLNVGTYSVEVTSATGQTVESLAASLEIGPSSDAHSFDKLEDLLANLSGGGGGFAFASKQQDVRITEQSLSFPSVSAGTIGSQIINNFNSTTEQAEPIHSDVIGGSSRWYLLSAISNGTMVVDTLGSDIDTVLSVYIGSNIFTLQLVASDNNGASDGVRSLVRLPVTSGQDYLIAVDGVNGAQGNIVLNWRMGIPPNMVGPAQDVISGSGSNLVLQAGVSNNVTLPRFQWRRNGLNIAGATNSNYTISSLQYDQVGSYSVAVSNLVGDVVNAIATVRAQSPLKVARDIASSVRLTGSATQAMILQLSTNLSAWTPLYTNSSPLLPISYLDTNSPVRVKGFYRLQPWP